MDEMENIFMKMVVGREVASPGARKIRFTLKSFIVFPLKGEYHWAKPWGLCWKWRTPQASDPRSEQCLFQYIYFMRIMNCFQFSSQTFV